ncbi:hypothetical protein H4219_005121 [Mycoemilia scoparia]|uniref:Uncharacterized protein n=1 Tax=Mycoemilia scoparia TaxID=417184 RepID=A0A9W7ZQ88_9FUNG|nr:hypothetical protein H4219_005121 [Mycoemilia scoparia]
MNNYSYDATYNPTTKNDPKSTTSNPRNNSNDSNDSGIAGITNGFLNAANLFNYKGLFSLTGPTDKSSPSSTATATATNTYPQHYNHQHKSDEVQVREIIARYYAKSGLKTPLWLDCPPPDPPFEDELGIIMQPPTSSSLLSSAAAAAAANSTTTTTVVTSSMSTGVVSKLINRASKKKLNSHHQEEEEEAEEEQQQHPHMCGQPTVLVGCGYDDARGLNIDNLGHWRNPFGSPTPSIKSCNEKIDQHNGGSGGGGGSSSSGSHAFNEKFKKAKRFVTGGGGGGGRSGDVKDPYKQAMKNTNNNTGEKSNRVNHRETNNPLAMFERNYEPQEFRTKENILPTLDRITNTETSVAPMGVKSNSMNNHSGNGNGNGNGGNTRGNIKIEVASSAAKGYNGIETIQNPENINTKNKLGYKRSHKSQFQQHPTTTLSSNSSTTNISRFRFSQVGSKDDNGNVPPPNNNNTTTISSYSNNRGGGGGVVEGGLLVGRSNRTGGDVRDNHHVSLHRVYSDESTISQKRMFEENIRKMTRGHFPSMADITKPPQHQSLSGDNGGGSGEFQSTQQQQQQQQQGGDSSGGGGGHHSFSKLFNFRHKSNKKSSQTQSVPSSSSHKGGSSGGSGKKFTLPFGNRKTESTNRSNNNNNNVNEISSGGGGIIPVH